MKALILAAGTGSRLGSLTAQRPKPLVEVGGKTLLDHCLDTLEAIGVEQTVVVGGYRFPVLQAHLENRPQPVTLVENPRYRQGNLLTLLAAKDHLRGAVLVMNVDHLYPVELVARFLNSGGDRVRLACDFDRQLGSDDMKVALDGQGRLQRISKQLADYSGGYIGMTLIPAPAMEGYLEAVEATYAARGDGAVVEEVLGHLAAVGRAPLALDLSGYGWLEIDSPDDLHRAEALITGGR